MDWGTAAHIGSVVLGVLAVAGMLRASGKNRQTEMQEIKDACRDRIDKHCLEDRDKRRAIYDEMERKIAALSSDMWKKFKEIENEFVRREMCDVLHGSLKEGIDGVRDDIRRLNEMDGA